MTRLIFMVEEPSMEALLEDLLPRILPRGIGHLIISHEGIQHLQRSIPKKLRAWQTPDDRFVILQDAHSADCVDVKKKLRDLCQKAGHPDTLIRIICPELESWFLGDLTAVGQAFDRPKLAKLQVKKKFREPDKRTNAADELRKLLGQYSKIANARDIAPHMRLDKNLSPSFQAFLSGIARLFPE